MQAFKIHATVPDNHRLILALPEEIPTGEVEIIILSKPRISQENNHPMAERLAALQRAQDKFGELLSGSEIFAATKQQEITLEESRFE